MGLNVPAEWLGHVTSFDFPLKRVTSHTFYHRFVTQLLQANFNIRTIQVEGIDNRSNVADSIRRSFNVVMR